MESHRGSSLGLVLGVRLFLVYKNYPPSIGNETTPNVKSLQMTNTLIIPEETQIEINGVKDHYASYREETNFNRPQL